ncbi:MAG: gfo/Idh/MocA family oxidoreductase [Verrucomicrobia bacterium]|nr:gfo/Idh/MocA family oxidoreductase [Verrucomicrobiota bacterium]
MNSNSHSDLSRREFVRNGSLALGAMALPNILHAENKTDRIRIGLVGCGGRGTGAANNALTVDPNVQLVAVGDVFEDRLSTSLAGLTAKYASTPGRVDVPKERQFVGLDAYKKVIESDIDVVLLAAPPGFRPLHFAAAVAAGKHIFCEKPMATDAAGLRNILESTRKAKEKRLSVVAGFCWRYDGKIRALFEKVHAGEIGEVRGLYHTYLTGPVKPMPAPETRKEGTSELEWQLRNWMNFVWLAGDGLVEQACHSVDKMLWAMKDVAPLRCTATGGRQIPNPGGNIFDHIEVNFEWANGVRGVMAQRQMAGCFNDNSDYITGEFGMATTHGGVRITGKNNWKAEGKFIEKYEQEHKELYDSIRAGTPHNDGEWMCQSTLAAIMGRMAAYTGQQVTWEHMLKSEEVLFPSALSWDMELPVAPMASPGRTKLV